jgi:hypothetical protein
MLSRLFIYFSPLAHENKSWAHPPFLQPIHVYNVSFLVDVGVLTLSPKLDIGRG